MRRQIAWLLVCTVLETVAAHAQPLETDFGATRDPLPSLVVAVNDHAPTR